MKKLICFFLTIFVLMISLTSCSLITNFIDVEPLCLVELEEEIYFLSFFVDFFLFSGARSWAHSRIKT